MASSSLINFFTTLYVGQRTNAVLIDGCIGAQRKNNVNVEVSVLLL